MLSLRLTQLTISVVVGAVSLMVVFLTRTWLSVVGVAAAISLAVYAGFRTVDKLSLLPSSVVRTITSKIFPFVRRKVKSYSRSVDPSVGYELQKELRELLDCIVLHCVESWYSHISECQSPVTDACLLISNVIKLLLVRLASIDRCRFLCRILCLYRQHLDSCSDDEVRQHFLASFAHRRNVSTYNSVAHPGSKQTTNICLSGTVQYLNTVVLMIENKLLDEQSANCMLGKEILSQIIVKKVILRILDIASEPEWLFNIVADILSDSSYDSLDGLTNCVCILAANNAEIQDNNTACTNDVMDCHKPKATVIDSADSAAEAESASSTKDARLNYNNESHNLADTVPLLSIKLSQYSDYLDVTKQCATKEMSEVEAKDIPSACEVIRHASYNSDRSMKDSRRLRSNSECCLTCERKKPEMLSVEKGHNLQIDSGVDITPELSGIDSTMSASFVNFVRKKRSSLVSKLPSFKTQDETEKVVGCESRHNGIYHVPDGVEVPVKEDPSAGNSRSTAGSSIFSHKKTKSFGSSEEVVKPCISHSASVSALAPESGLDTPAGFISKHFSHLVRRFSTGLERIPLFRSGSSDLLFTEEDCASGVEFVAITDLEASATEASATEASEDFVINYQPDFLFKNICISVPERVISVSKSYTIYVISVWAWYEVAADSWQLLFSTVSRRYREFIALQNALEANPAYASSLKGIRSPSRLTSIPFVTNVAAVVEYRQKKLEMYLQSLLLRRDINNGEELKQFLSYELDPSIAFAQRCSPKSLPRIDKALRKLSGVVNRISTIIPNSSDVSPSITLDSGSRHHATGSNVEGWTDEDALKIDVITNRTRQDEMTIVYQYENEVFACDETYLQLVPMSSVENNINSKHASAVDSCEFNVSQPSCWPLGELLPDSDLVASSHDDVSIQENAGMASAVLDILSTCLIGSDSWLTLPAAMTLARLTISYFLNMWIEHEVNRLTTRSRCAYYVSILRQAIWPPADDSNGCSSAAKAAEHSGNVHHHRLPSPTERLSAARCRARSALVQFFPGIIQFVVGNQAFSRVVETLLSSVENREHNRALLLAALDIIVEEAFPDILSEMIAS